MLKRTLGSVALFVAIIGTAGLVWLNRYNVYDWVQLRDYIPPAEVADMVPASGMADYGRRLFYVNNPQISDRTTFNQECTTTEQTIVLGCYTGTNIYIFRVDDPKLQGVEEVTAAHEMLHAAYQRLSPTEKKRVNKLLDDAYRRVNDPKLTETLASYQKTEPGQESNELHSILGTEYQNLGPELEAYYGKYFFDRSKVVALSNAYKQVFIDMESQVAKYDADLQLRKSEITRREAELELQAKQLESQKAQMDALLASGQARAYNNLVASYNNGVNSYNKDVAVVKSLIDEYNVLVEQRNGLAVQQQGLAKSLDSRVDTLQSSE